MDLEEKKALLDSCAPEGTTVEDYQMKATVPHQKRHLAVALLGLIFLTLASIYGTMPCTYLPLLLRDNYDIPESTSAFIISAQALAYVGSCLVSPKLDDIINQEHIMVYSAFLYAITDASFATILYLPTIWIAPVAIIIRALAGFTCGIFEMIFSTFLYRKFPNNIGAVAASLESAVMAGIISGPIFGGTVYSLTGDFATTTLVPIIPVLLVYVWFAYLILTGRQKGINSTASSETKQNGSFLKVLRTWQMMILLFLPFYGSLVLNVPSTITAPYVYDTFGGEAMMTGILFSGMSAGYWSGALFTGLLTDSPRFRKTGLWIFALCPFLFAVGNFIVGPAFFLPFKPSPYWTGGGFFLAALALGAGCGPTMRLLLTMWKELHPACEVDYTAYISSLFLVTFTLGEGIGNAVGGVLYKYMSFNQINTMFGISLLLVGAINAVFLALMGDKLGRAS